MPQWIDKLKTHLHGRRIGLIEVSTVESGGNHGSFEFLAGVSDVRVDTNTAETTGTNLKPFGYSVCPGTSAASSAVYTIDPPIRGIRKTITSSSNNGPVYIKTANGETIHTTLGTTHNTVKISSVGGTFELIGITTAIWKGLGLTSGTSSNASGFGLTTST